MQKAPAARASVAKSNGRFELPQLTPVNYSLTDGTDIPPPPDSPIEQATTPPLVPEKGTENATGNGTTTPSTANGAYQGRGRTSNADHEPPLSPASTTRPGSIRRFLSRRSLNSTYTNGGRSTDDLSAHGGERPASALSKPKRSKSWFRRLAGGSSSSSSGNRTSIVYENSEPEKKGPPAPTLPALNQFKAKIADGDEGSLGAEDMFKNIK